jgi:hypothetical protein
MAAAVAPAAAAVPTLEAQRTAIRQSYNPANPVAKSAQLVSDLKKTQTFLRKLKVLSEHPGPQLITDANTLNTSKYVEELAASMAEV